MTIPLPGTELDPRIAAARDALWEAKRHLAAVAAEVQSACPHSVVVDDGYRFGEFRRLCAACRLKERSYLSCGGEMLGNRRGARLVLKAEQLGFTDLWVMRLPDTGTPEAGE